MTPRQKLNEAIRHIRDVQAQLDALQPAVKDMLPQCDRYQSEADLFWRSVREAAARVETWPAWKRTRLGGTE